MGFLDTLTLQPAHGYTVGVALFSAVVNVYGIVVVVKARKKYKCAYPTLYMNKDEKNAKEFNCCQRAHQNYLENWFPTIMFMGLASIHRPVAAAACGFVRFALYLAYIRGYSTGNPEKRMFGNFGYIGYFGLIGMSAELAYKLITA